MGQVSCNRSKHRRWPPPAAIFLVGFGSRHNLPSSSQNSSTENRAEFKGTNHLGQTGFCKHLRFAAVFFENLRALPRKSENLQKSVKFCEKNCEFGSVCPFEFAPCFPLRKVCRAGQSFFVWSIACQPSRQNKICAHTTFLQTSGVCGFILPKMGRIP